MIIIVRHGETSWNLKKRKQGHKNSKLTLKGKKQAIKVAKFFNKKKYNLNDFILYSSSLKRVTDYTKIINYNLIHKFNFKKKVKFNNQLKEHKFGDWEGKNDNEIKKIFPEQFKKRKADKWNYVVPRGESYNLLYKRVKKFITKNIDLKKNYVIFSHDMVSRVFRGYLMKYKINKIMDLEHKNSSIFIYKNKSLREYKL